MGSDCWQLADSHGDRVTWSRWIYRGIAGSVLVRVACEFDDVSGWVLRAEVFGLQGSRRGSVDLLCIAASYPEGLRSVQTRVEVWALGVNVPVRWEVGFHE